MNVSGGLSVGDQWRGKRMEVHYTDTYEDGTMKPTRHCLEKRGEGRARIAT
jgi:hypothetical protein